MITIYTNFLCPLKFKNTDLSVYDKILATIRQGDISITVEPTVVSETMLEVELSQRDTARLTPNKTAEIMCNFWKDGKRTPSEIKKIDVGDNLLRKVIE